MMDMIHPYQAATHTNISKYFFSPSSPHHPFFMLPLSDEISKNEKLNPVPLYVHTPQFFKLPSLMHLAGRIGIIIHIVHQIFCISKFQHVTADKNSRLNV